MKDRPKEPSSDRSNKASQGKTVTSEQLLGPMKQLDIEHRGDRYTLRITTNDKLILTK